MLKDIKNRRYGANQKGLVPRLFRSRAVSNQIASESEKQRGFTIIEVMIVLAIAALILVIVFLAVPALQRSTRNTQRKTDASNSLAALSNYVSNHNGGLPAATCTATAAADPTQAANTGACGFVGDAKLGYYQPTKISFKVSTSGLTVIPNTPAGHEILELVGNAQCTSDATAKPAPGDSARQYVAYYGVEGSAGAQCVDG